MKHENQPHFIEWSVIAKEILGVANAQEKEEFNHWIKEDPSHHAYFKKATLAWELGVEMPLPEVEEMIDSFDKAIEKSLNSKLKKNKPTKQFPSFVQVHKHPFFRKSGFPILRIAAIFAILFFNSLLIVNYLKTPKQKNSIQEIITTENEPFPVFSKINKAVLVLSSGDEILLDTLSNKIHLFENGVSIKRSKNTLEYSCSSNQKTNRKNTIYIPRGKQFNIKLADGSEIKLNAETILQYPIDLCENQRHLFLDGESFFKVNPSNLPFLVTTLQAEIKVYGTIFNVYAYSSENVFSASLLSGKIGVTHEQQECKLNSGEEAIIRSNSEAIVVQKSNTYACSSWTSDILIFENERLEDIASKISRMYDVDIRFEDASLKNLHFTGDFDKKRGLNKFLNILESITHVQITKNKQEIIFDKYKKI